jgi:hypothetical protein
MDDLDGRIREKVVERVVCPCDTERLGSRGTTFWRAPENAPDLDADPAQGLHVDRADEARPDDGRTDVGDPRHGPLTRPSAWR